MAFQVSNQLRPNSADHTIIFACLEADDNLPNMHVAFDAYKPVISELQGMKWRWASYEKIWFLSNEWFATIVLLFNVYSEYGND